MSDERITLKHELTALLGKHSEENTSCTPDFILAEYLIMCLSAFNESVRLRSLWYMSDDSLRSRHKGYGEKPDESK